MKIKVGLKFKAIEGLSKGKTFTVISVSDKEVQYRSEFTDMTYTADRKYFEKYLERVNKYWSEKNKSYKYKKSQLE